MIEQPPNHAPVDIEPGCADGGQRLRRYIEDEPARPRHLQTVRGVGYRFVAMPEQVPG